MLDMRQELLEKVRLCFLLHLLQGLTHLDSDVLFRHIKGHAKANSISSCSDPGGGNRPVAGDLGPGLAPSGLDAQVHHYSMPLNPGEHLARIVPADDVPATQASLHISMVEGPFRHEGGTHLHTLQSQSGSQIESHLIERPFSDVWAIQTQVDSTVNASLPPQETRTAPPSCPAPSSEVHAQTPKHRPHPETTRSEATLSSHEMDFPWAPERELRASNDLNEFLQNWLLPQDEDTTFHSNLIHTYNGYHSGHQMQQDLAEPEGTSAHLSDDSIRMETIHTVPKERFSRVQRCWEPRPGRVHRLMPNLWEEVVSSSRDNLFSEGTFTEPDPKAGHSWGFDGDCRLRLKEAFHDPSISAYHSPRATPSPHTSNPSNLRELADFPPTEILDISLGIFFRRFHQVVPFIHIPTFCAQTTPLPLLFIMCLIGLSVLGTSGATAFVSRTFRGFLRRVCEDLASCMAETITASHQLTVFATAMLMLNLVAMMGDNVCLAQCQILYVNLLATVQQHGLFAANEGQSLEALLSQVTDLERQWSAWSKAESAKRFILRLLLIDAWFANHLSLSPIVRSEAVSIFAPCDESLFRAKSASEWQRLLRNGRLMHQSTLSLDDLVLCDPITNISSERSGVFALLAILQTPLLESYHRLVLGRRQTTASLVPWHRYSEDPRAKSLAPALIAVAGITTSSSQSSDMNCTVLWHSMCIMLLANVQIFELAAGRHGATPASEALFGIAQWSQTAAARRACVHAAQTFKLMSNRRVSDTVTIPSISSLFTSALVLGLYLFMVPLTSIPNTEPIELAEVHVDWVEFADLGFQDIEEPIRRPTHDGDPSPINHFIRDGGPISICGVTHHCGYETARRVLLDFANLMEGMSKRQLRTFTQVLHIMSDDLMNIDTLP